MNELEKNPWTRLERKQIYDNPWIRVWEDQVINPSGGKGIYGVVSFKNVAVGILPLDEEGYTWLVGQYRYTLDLYSWEIPMGGGAMGVSPLESAQRELREETGLLASHWEELVRIHTSNCVTDEFGVAYLAKGLTQGPTEFDETEDLRIWRLPFKQALGMVLNGEITDSLSVAAILKAARIMGQ